MVSRIAGFVEMLKDSNMMFEVRTLCAIAAQVLLKSVRLNFCSAQFFLNFRVSGWSFLNLGGSGAFGMLLCISGSHRQGFHINEGFDQGSVNGPDPPVRRSAGPRPPRTPKLVYNFPPLD